MRGMNTEDSAVHFATAARAHLAFATQDLQRGIAFYSALLQQAPTKVRPDYAKFEVAEPPLNLTLNLASRVTVPEGPEHFGIQVKSKAEVQRRASAMGTAGEAGAPEEAVTCCYAVQDKVWFQDPEGRRWEVFVVLEADTAVHSEPKETASASQDAAACCAPTCCQ